MNFARDVVDAAPPGRRALVVVVFGLIYVHMRKPEWHVLDAAIFAVSLTIVWLGIVVAG